MLGKLFALFTLVTLLETYLLYLLGSFMGPLWTLALIVLSAALGAWLTKREGLKIWVRWREALSLGEVPEEGVLSGVLVLVGAVLLVTPGVLTDLTGIALLVPPSRRLVSERLSAYLQARFEGAGVVTHGVRVQGSRGSYTEQVHARFDLGGPPGASRRPRVIDAEGETVEAPRGSDPDQGRSRQLN